MQWNERIAKMWLGVGALLFMVMSPGLSGCYDHSCTDTLVCPYVDEVEEPECPADPAEGKVDGECGVWLSSSLGDDANPGTPEAPVATFAQAMTLAGAARKRVYTCAEPFIEKVVLPPGISLFGGFACADLRWRYAGTPALTRLTAPADVIPLTLAGVTGGEASTVTDFDVRAADAIVPGGSSIAVLALEQVHVTILRSYFTSGNGADGIDGGAGDHLGQPAKKGLSGKDGMGACTAKPGLGGEEMGLACDDGNTLGGQGGDGGELSAAAGGDGQVLQPSNPQGFGLAGQGENLAMALACTPGIGGAAGADGQDGLGAMGLGHLRSEGFIGIWGGDGTPGWPGQGGGGGGASAGNAICGAAPHGGAGGGSGGTGGCGGKGGKGGQPGGASIALATLSSSIFGDVVLTAGRGGNGGNGGILQSGGQGGLPGIGGAGSGGMNGTNPGCIGGGGGYGGDGGHGGGGRGGPSICLASVVGQDAPRIMVWTILGQPGKAGFGGNPALPFSNGENDQVGYEAHGLLP